MSQVIWGEVHLVIWDNHALGLYRSPLYGRMAFNVFKNNLFKKEKIFVVTIAWLPLGTTTLTPRHLSDH